MTRVEDGGKANTDFEGIHHTNTEFLEAVHLDVGGHVIEKIICGKLTLSIMSLPPPEGTIAAMVKYHQCEEANTR